MNAYEACHLCHTGCKVLNPGTAECIENLLRSNLDLRSELQTLKREAEVTKKQKLTRKERKDRILELLPTLDFDTLMEIRDDTYPDDERYYTINSLDALTIKEGTLAIVSKAVRGNFDPECFYFTIDDEGNYQSLREDEISFESEYEDMADYLLQRKEWYINEQLYEIMNMEDGTEDADQEV